MKISPKPIALLIGGILLAGPLLAEHPTLPGSWAYEGYKTCKRCHSDEWDTHAADIMASLHWTWEKTDEYTGQQVGKINIINNYCVAVPSNEPRCTSCHIGIGWTDNTFDKANSDNIDCLICHDQTGTYKKTPTGAGAPVAGLDYAAIFSNLTPMQSGRENCGACHFYGGGGDAVKHGTLDSTMANPLRAVDVHMGTDGMNMNCVQCHKSSVNKHEFQGSRYSKSTTDNMLCQNCHTASPVGHSGTMNMHTSKVACQTCHIPAMARGGKATKMFWDWTTAGDKNPDGSTKVIKDENGNEIYNSMKGSFVWEENVIPEYVWFNGNVTHVTLDDPVMQGQVVKINQLHGDLNDANARIFPVKRFRGIQPYDMGRGTLAIPNLFPNNAEDTDAFWKSYDWEKSLTSGMAYVGETFIGPVGQVETEMYWIQNHMVAPKEQALTCTDCHTVGSRLNFSQLGYPAERAASLQTMFQSDFWAGYPVRPDLYVDTGAWIGWLYVGSEPWVYSVTLGKYIYVPESSVTAGGGWAFVPN